MTRNWESPDGRDTSYQAIISMVCTPDVLEEFHDSSSGGYLVVIRTLARGSNISGSTAELMMNNRSRKMLYVPLTKVIEQEVSGN